MARESVPPLKTCRECQGVRPAAQMAFCDLCRRWFCLACHRDQHWFACPGNGRDAGPAPKPRRPRPAA